MCKVCLWCARFLSLLNSLKAQFDLHGDCRPISLPKLTLKFWKVLSLRTEAKVSSDSSPPPPTSTSPVGPDSRPRSQSYSKCGLGTFYLFLFIYFIYFTFYLIYLLLFIFSSKMVPNTDRESSLPNPGTTETGGWQISSYSCHLCWGRGDTDTGVSWERRLPTATHLYSG